MDEAEQTNTRARLPTLSLVVAVAENGVIGREGDLPWRLSGDLQRFKQLTMGHALLMGRKTYESIGRPLPGRVSIVLTHRSDYQAGHERVVVARNLDEAQALVPTTGMNQSEAFVVGGAEIYRLALPRASRIYRTLVHATPAGGTTFPDVDLSQWRLIEESHYDADDKNEFACTVQLYERA